jgi:hypothetical protein
MIYVLVVGEIASKIREKPNFSAKLSDLSKIFNRMEL